MASFARSLVDHYERCFPPLYAKHEKSFGKVVDYRMQTMHKSNFSFLQSKKFGSKKLNYRLNTELRVRKAFIAFFVSKKTFAKK